MQYTSNLNLKKPDLTDYVEINDLNENMDIIDAEIKNLSEASGNLDELSTDEKNSLVLAVNELLNKIGTLSSLSTTEKSNLVASINEIKTKLTEHLDESKTGAHKAKNIALEDVSNLFTATTVEDGMKELFTNVSNGKQLVGTAITDVDNKVVVPTEPTFQNLADLIRSIASTRKKYATGTGYSSDGGAHTSFNGSTQTGPYISFDFSRLNFAPSFVFFYPTSKTANTQSGILAFWSKENLRYISASDYGNSVAPGRPVVLYRAPYVNGAVVIPSGQGGIACTWVAIE